MKEFSEANFVEFISDKSCLVKFGAEWCGPCKAVKPALEKVEEDTGIEVYDVDIDVHSDVATAYGIRSIPTTMAFKNGNPVDQLVGAYGEDAYKGLAEKTR